jgi:dTDP-4-amino-4,6-dideoxygalactose transaminase
MYRAARETKKMNIPLVDLKAQYASIKEEIDGAIQRVVQSGQFILGPEAKAFEDEMAAYCGTKYAVGVASGTDALHLALLACGIKASDEVITTPFTFIATAESIAKCGARPVFVDIDPKTYNIDPEKIEQYLQSRRITDHQSSGSPLPRRERTEPALSEAEGVRVKALLPVHLYGQPANMGRILDIAREHNLKVIEDCAQALGASYYSRQTQPTSTNLNESLRVSMSLRPSHQTPATQATQRTQRTEYKVGSLGDAGCLSFFPSKSLGAYGDGGMVVTDDAEIAQMVRILRVHGSRASYQHVMHGFNSRLDALQAAILRVKLKHVDRWTELRRSKAALYSRLLSQVDGIAPPYMDEGCESSWNYYTVRIKSSRLNRDELRKHLESKGIQTAIYYPLSLHLQEVYKYLGHKPGDFPQSELAQEQVLTLPMYPELSEEQLEEIVSEIKRFVNR